MATNPFYVNPLGGQGRSIAQGLVGLGQLAEDKRQADIKQQRANDFRTRASEVLQSGSPMDAANLSLDFPEYQERFQQAYGITNNASKEMSKRGYAGVMSAQDNQSALNALVDLKAQLNAAGIQNTPNVDKDIARLQTDDPNALKNIQIGAALTMPSLKEYLPGDGAKVSKVDFSDTGAFVIMEDGTSQFQPLPTDEIERRKAEAAEKAAKEGELKTSDIKGINKDITDFTKSYRAIRESAEGLDTLSKKKTAPAQMAMIFKFMKALDPGSTVREGEYASASNTTGVDGRIMNLYNQAVDGKMLTDQQAAQFVDVAKELSNTAANTVIETGNDYLNTYGDSITPQQRERFDKRLDVKMFDIAPTEEAEAQQPVATDSRVVEGAIIRNPNTGQKLQLINGQWTEVQ